MSGSRRYKRVEELEGPQRAAAEALANAVVAAGAGSGKTTVLAARFVRLLETGRLASGERAHARNVLVLTFTRKAAAEMYSRIYGALAEAASLAGESEAELRSGLAGHLAACLSDFSQAQISTFDSFAARIARSGSARYGIAPDFAIDEDRAREIASRLALSFVLGHREEESLRELVSALGLDGARDEVLAELALRRMTISSPPGFAAFHAVQAGRLEEMRCEARERLLAMREAALEYAGVKTTETSKRWMDALAADPGEDEGGFSAFLGGLEPLRKPGANSKDEASRFLSDSVEGIRAAIASYRDIAATKAAHPARLELYRRLDDFRLLWEAERRSAKTLTFRDVATLALDVLKLDPEVRRHYQELYRYIMIDEFQDDDELQKRILFLLAARPDSPGDEPSPRDLEPDKLFFVGDEKQSIYLFRGADVSVFRRLASELSEGSPAGPAAALGLSRNFRSEPGVIRSLNAIFPSVMAPRDGERGREDFEAAFEPLESREATPGVEPRFAYLELPYREGRGSIGAGEPSASLREAAECEAWEVARIVRDAVEGESLLVADREARRARPARYEDFALLLRSTGRQVHFEKYFRLFGVPYGSENACGLFSEAVACDLYYALRLALYPDDRNALAAYLRSPFAGLSDEAVARMLLEPPAAAAPEGAAGLRARAGLVPEGDRRGLALGAETLGRLEAMADREPIAACLRFLWYEAGYRAALLRDPVASAFEEHFELVHSLAAAADARGRPLASFVAELEALVGKPDKLEVDLPRESARGVRIMTVHKSKGLEFPVVIVPQANNVGQDRSSREAWYWEEGIGPTFRPPKDLGSRSRNAFFEASKERREAMDAAELKRLLYVALTRAESHLIVTATEPRSSDARGKSFRSLLAAPLGLFDAPSPLARPVDGSEGAAQASQPFGRVQPPFGELAALPSGVLVGRIPERSDLDYFRLVDGAGRASRPGGGPTPSPGPGVIERAAAKSTCSVTSLAEEAAGFASGHGAPSMPESLHIDPKLAVPEGLSAENWGSLVHAVLESRYAAKPTETRLRPALRAALLNALGDEKRLGSAIRRAGRLAEVFTASELGRRALAAGERYVELKVAIALAGPEPEGRGSPRVAKGSIDLAFVDGGKAIVVDYKTDSAMVPNGHELQLAAYERAAQDIFGLPAEAWVFYLYGGGRAVRAAGEALGKGLFPIRE
jgi:ATP-dependent exoDNAse (exonuclease V) beta subunit